MSKQFNVRIPELTERQLDDLTGGFGLTKTQVVLIAITMLHSHTFPDKDWKQSIQELRKS